jgi:ABC-2 type transport system permease protein
MKSLAIARASVRRITRDRTALFFLIVLPVFVILIIGASVRGFSVFKVGVVNEDAGPIGHQLTSALRHAPDLNVRTYPSLEAATKGVARGEVLTAVVLPAGLDREIRAGHTVTIGVMTEPANSNQQAAATTVDAVIARAGGRIQAALFTSTHVGESLATNLARVDALAPTTRAVGVRTFQVEGSARILPEGYSYSAPFALIALVQSALIVGVGAGVFGVSWGNPLAAATLVIVWALVGAWAGMLAGTLFRTQEQSNAVGTTLGIAFGMLGGCMWPLAVLSNSVREIGHVVPQAWAVDAWTSLLSRGGTVASIAPQL